MKLSKTFEVVTPESAEQGEYEESGFDFEAQEYTFKELIDLMRSEGFSQDGCTEWLTTCDPDRDYTTGSKTYYGLHFDRTNKPRQRKYWEKAIRYCKAKF